MKCSRIIVLSAVLCSFAAWLLTAWANPQTKSGEPPLIVHEWGTFTSFSGSNGVKLEFRPLEEKDLPGFVYDRTRLNLFSLSKSGLPAIQRMETPVTYFYTPVERDVTVRVDFPQGLLTEFYPPVKAFGPDGNQNPFGLLTEGSKATPPLKDSWLDWGRVHLIPTESLRAAVQDPELSRRIGRHVETTMIPDAGQFRHYAAARATDSAILQVRRSKETGTSPGVLQGDYFEKFLFYRGLGNFDLPLTLKAGRNGNFSLINTGKDDIRSLFLVTVRGKQIQFRLWDRIAGGATLDLQPSRQASTIKDLSKAVVQSLVAEGLYDKEAQAMVATWQTSWFGEEGTRLFYIVPQRMTDELLPLTITPRPTELVRVLVGRMEIMTPSQEQEVLDLVQRSLSLRPSLTKDQPSTLLPEFQKLGRLGEPALVRVQHMQAAEPVQQEAQRLIRELRAKQAKGQGG